MELVLFPCLFFFFILKNKKFNWFTVLQAIQEALPGIHTWGDSESLKSWQRRSGYLQDTWQKQDISANNSLIFLFLSYFAFLYLFYYWRFPQLRSHTKLHRVFLFAFICIKKFPGQVQWLMSVILAFWEAEVGGSQGEECEISLANMVKPCLY